MSDQTPPLDVKLKNAINHKRRLERRIKAGARLGIDYTTHDLERAAETVRELRAELRKAEFHFWATWPAPKAS